MSSPVSEVLCSSWAVFEDIPAHVIEALTAEGVTPTPELLDPVLLRASELLFYMSGRTWYGTGCEATAVLRSYPDAPGTGTWPYHDSWGVCGCWTYGTWLDGRYYPNPRFPDRHIDVPIAIRLPRAPITSVVSVTVGGEPFAAWNLLRSGWLERTDGQGWNVCGGDTEVIYRFGEPPPQAGIDAAIELGIEILRDQMRLDSCRLPPNVVSVTRQGITMEMAADTSRPHHTGLYLVDLWLEAVNPHARPQSARVWSPDVPRLMTEGPTREV